MFDRQYLRVKIKLVPFVIEKFERFLKYVSRQTPAVLYTLY
jgi:hypothetical protein